MIVDDVIYYDESPFQDGPIAQAVNDVTADGALYFSSAGNEGNTLDGTAGHYEGDFRGSGRTVGKFAGEAHDFDPRAGGAGLRADLAQNSVGAVVTTVLGRAAGQRPRPTTTSTSSTQAGTLLSFAQNVQDGDDDPVRDRVNMTVVRRAATGSRSCASPASRATSSVSRVAAAASGRRRTGCRRGSPRA